MNRFILTLAVIAMPLAAHASTLAADSLLCESEPVAFQAATIIIDDGVSPPATKSLELARSHMRSHGKRILDPAIGADLSPESHLLLAMSQARLPAKYEPYRQILLTCAPSGANPLTGVEVIVRRPISGVAQVRTTLHGQAGVFWVKAASLAD